MFMYMVWFDFSYF